jgi:hypothetical protein
LGVISGAALGAFAGPIGIVAGAVVGSAVGAGLAIAHNRQMHRESEDVDRYDDELGIMSGQMGAPNLEHPPATVGCYSIGSMLGGEADSLEGDVAEGPITMPDD